MRAGDFVTLFIAESSSAQNSAWYMVGTEYIFADFGELFFLSVETATPCGFQAY
jgi:hypothetical protein